MAPCRMMWHAAHLLLSVVKRLMAMVCTGVPRLPAMVTGPSSVHSSTLLLVVVATTNLQHGTALISGMCHTVCRLVS